MADLAKVGGGSFSGRNTAAYAASAKIIRTVDEMQKTLLDAFA